MDCRASVVPIVQSVNTAAYKAMKQRKQLQNYCRIDYHREVICTAYVVWCGVRELAWSASCFSDKSTDVIYSSGSSSCCGTGD